MRFVITSDRDVSIDGIGTLKGGESKEISAEELDMFRVMNGVSLAQANFPNFVKVDFIVSEEAKEVKKAKEVEK